ncbi:hypothetical protein Tco_0429723 [Tanacetum coccineum]
MTKKYAELSATEKLQADCDMKAINIILQGLPTEIYSLVNHHRVAKDLWEKVQRLCKYLVDKAERECLPPEWSKFVTDVKLVKDLHTTNFDQLYAYLEQHELHANEVRLMRERNQDPLALDSAQELILQEQEGLINSGSTKDGEVFNCPREGHMAKTVVTTID